MTKITSSQLKLKAVPAEHEIAKYLDIADDIPLLLSSAVTYGIPQSTEVPIETFRTYYLTDYFEYTLTQNVETVCFSHSPLIVRNLQKGSCIHSQLPPY